MSPTHLMGLERERFKKEKEKEKAQKWQHSEGPLQSAALTRQAGAASLPP